MFKIYLAENYFLYFCDLAVAELKVLREKNLYFPDFIGRFCW